MPEIILIFGEGPTDYGKPGSNGNQWKDGPIQPLIRKSVCKEILLIPMVALIHSDYPKHYLRRVLEQFNKQSCREIYHEIAEEIDIKTLKSKCSISFGKFFKDVQKI